MSWGYFADLRLRLPASEWRVLRARAPLEVPLPAGWSGLVDRSLERRAATARFTLKFERSLHNFQGKLRTLCWRASGIFER